MAKKEKSYNPAQEQHKKDKKRAADKVKQQRQNAQLAHLSRRNPATLESQIAALKAQSSLNETDSVLLATLEKEVRLIKKAKARAPEVKGPVIVSDKTKGREEEFAKLKEKEERKAFRDILKNKRDPKRSVYYDEVWNPYGVPPPGMPWKERDEDDSEGWSTDSEVRRIPMPRDTPPLSKKPKSVQPVVIHEPTPPPVTRPKPVEKAPEPVVVKEGPSDSVEEAFLRAGATVIEAAPVLRDFQKEAVSFVPSIVKRRPPKKAKKAEETAKVSSVQAEEKGDAVKSEEKSFATTVEDAVEEESEGTRESMATEEKPIIPTPPVVEPPVAKPAVQETLKRPLEQEPKPTETPPVTAPKRRRMVNAAPDV